MKKNFATVKFGSKVFGKTPIEWKELHQDYRRTEIGRQNWEVCARMFMHDILDLSVSNPPLAAVLKHYNIRYTDEGGYTMALPRMGVIGTLPKNAKGRIA